MCRESPDKHQAIEETSGAVAPPIEDLFSFNEDQVDFMSAQSFPSSDPPPSQSTTVPPESSKEGDQSGGNGS